MTALRDPARSAKRWIDRCEQFVRDYTAGLRAQDLHRLFDREALQALDVLARDQNLGPEPEGDFRRFWYRVRIAFLGLSYKLTPARRVLFAASLLFALLGLGGFGLQIRRDDQLVFDASPLWFLVSLGCLYFLLTLELVDQIRVRDELEVARDLQSDLLPRTVPDLDDYQIAHTYRTANEVGGDYYDFPVLPDGRLAIMVGDASGHGMAAGLLMAIANATLKMALDIDPHPEAVLTLLNRTLCRTGDTRAFMTLFFGLLDPATGRLEYASAGHPFPVLRRRDGAISELGRGCLPLGIREPIELLADTVTLDPRDILILFSDGLPEAVNSEDATFGYERIKNLVSDGGSPAAVLERILAAFDAHLAGRSLDDDFSLVVLRRGRVDEDGDGEGSEVKLPPLPR